MLFANESPRYLAQKSPDKAWTVLAKLRGLPIDHPYVQQEMNGIMSQLEEERANFSGTNMVDLFKEAFATRSNRRRSVLCVTLMMWSNLTGTNAMTYYSPSIFASIGLSSTTSGLLATGVYGIVKMIACTIFILFVSDNLGRRKSFLWTGIGQVSSYDGALILSCVLHHTCFTWTSLICFTHVGNRSLLCRVLHSLRSTNTRRADQCTWLRRDRRHICIRLYIPIRLGTCRLDILLSA